MKHFLTGLGIFIFGFILLSICSSIWGNGGNADSSFLILISIFYLSAIIGGSTSLILEELRERNN
ncbi:hypothetical protein R2R35_11470 [Anaerocolumna sp. AGMB13020]|uniref:hypothetical protein n=1 Tax=Anaerocolumna sp. AGMB13020 TaxID=3081750 RepID=UPI002954EC5A|nr:hypothetical protein [Anaerocolumna sp. AGMB13020]WOO39070.1 hypothetical protein R2R35_11470 [Anaerocolumna sp. AGMB13020]